jgi:hypothetical protein
MPSSAAKQPPPPPKPGSTDGKAGYLPGSHHSVDKVDVRAETRFNAIRVPLTMSAPQKQFGTGLRRARTYTPIQRLRDASDTYPVGCSAFLTSIHDARYYQGILSNTHNFSTATNCDIFHVQDGKAEWKRDVTEDEMLRYLQVTPVRGCDHETLAKLSTKESGQSQTPVFRVM